MAPPDRKKHEEIKAKFKELDKNGDGLLDFTELCGLLRQGNPSMKDKEVRALFNQVDKDHNGTVEFTEFVDFLYGSGEPRPEKRRGAGAAVGDDGSEVDWGAVEQVFAAYAGHEAALDGKGFAKMCKECGLFDAKFTKNDVDIVFAKVAKKGQRRIALAEFKDGIRHVAQRKGCATSVVQEKVGNSSGPQISGTKVEGCRFHDDKSTYTGAHAPEGAGDNGGRHTRLADKGAPKPDDAEDDWEGVDSMFKAYAGKGDDIDGREFAKVCVDCNLYDRRFTKNDVDIVYAKICVKGERRIKIAQFQDALRVIAEKKACPTSHVQQLVAYSSGPQVHATKTEAVRFHDDKSTYTGAHTGADGHGETESQRHDRLHNAAAPKADAEEADWKFVQSAFEGYTHGGELTQNSFAKLCADCNLFDKKFRQNDVDLTFAKFCRKGERKIKFDQFQDCVRVIAEKKGIPTQMVQELIAVSEGPVMHGTKTDHVKFHDDTESYTGAHSGK
eukprot:gnl/TRDRNA2_/TRDRNA2_132407_c0_seq1.p1 gnl/TRDRNA2_/TRDRNA2_132407_c0~~gnl/TRDRNA2_/TRDRNA2_132407_c0_seq1.p1  ORF type:complete len:500 (-),score=118.75 gnl/TRDRNA2_/TRDRNA2_132407_c0_seq1:188-1687(-)